MCVCVCVVSSWAHLTPELANGTYPTPPQIWYLQLTQYGAEMGYNMHVCVHVSVQAHINTSAKSPTVKQYSVRTHYDGDKCIDHNMERGTPTSVQDRGIV